MFYAVGVATCNLIALDRIHGNGRGKEANSSNVLEMAQKYINGSGTAECRADGGTWIPSVSRVRLITQILDLESTKIFRDRDKPKHSTTLNNPRQSHHSLEMASRPTVTILSADGTASGATHPLPKVFY